MNLTPHAQYSTAERATLLEIAAASIKHGLEQGTPLRVTASDYPADLQQHRACFVTLSQGGALRGCIGHLEAQAPIVEDVAENAYAAAFRDPRFPPLTEREADNLEIHISVLTPAEAIAFESEQELIGKIRPAVDGLILVEGQRRGTFLPSVWESLPETRNFLSHLKQKAGLPANYWSSTLEVYRYETESFSNGSS
ncbi:AmmeMemoRadiSam system protein A [Candidatus Thiodiazotropha sp. CDECU1]|uniref:AmmeMemoRadiSam system protein A n=1 Tax=Candidatus Thiodiazotropha sp. CDECU1 TaxID=3065865 RepID=UPI00292FF833|nr:AmmeMemoRadiSam system protein A [Candidatus Thiodiazotropha sp. CDECU1]